MNQRRSPIHNRFQYLNGYVPPPRNVLKIDHGQLAEKAPAARPGIEAEEHHRAANHKPRERENEHFDTAMVERNKQERGHRKR